MSSPRGFSIRIFLPDGSPEGMKVVEKSNWVGSAIVCPRARFTDLKNRPEYKKTGAYVLIGQPIPDDLPSIYIGEGDPVAERLQQHQKQKDFWTSVVFFTSKDNNLNKAHVQYLEAKLIARAYEAKRCHLENGNKPTLPSLSEADIAEMEEFLDQVLLILPTLGVSVFQKPDSGQRDAAILHLPRLKSRGLAARGYEVAEGFVVLAESQSPKEHQPSTEPHVVRVRKRLLDEGLFVKEDNHLKLIQDYTFSSPSTAASVMLGRTANGRTEWQDENGRQLKEIQTAEATQDIE